MTYDALTELANALDIWITPAGVAQPIRDVDEYWCIVEQLIAEHWRLT